MLAKCETRTEIVVLFMALLEMIKGGGLWAEQDQPFGDIVLVEAGGDAGLGTTRDKRDELANGRRRVRLGGAFARHS